MRKTRIISKRFLFAAVAVLLLSTALPISSQQTLPIVSRAITMSEAVDIALKNNPTLQARQAMITAAAARVRMARAMTRPQITATSYATGSSMPMIVPGPEVVSGPQAWTLTPDTERLNGILMGMYPLYTGGKLRAQIESAHSSSEAAVADLAVSELDVSLAAKITYYQVLLAREMVNVYEDRVAEAQERLRIAEKAFEEGRIARYDLLRNRTDRAESQQQLNNARRDVEVTLADLKSALGISQESNITLADTLATPQPLEDVTTLRQLAVRQRPEVTAAHARIKAARSGVGVAKSAYKPQIYAMGMAELAASSESTDTGALVGITVSIPILDGGLRKSAVDEAQTMVQQAEAEKREVLLAVERDVSTAYARVSAAAENVTLAKAAVEQAEEDYRIIKLRYEAGKSINVEVLDALASLTRARTDYVAALYNYNVARADLLRAIGQR